MQGCRLPIPKAENYKIEELRKTETLFNQLVKMN